MPLFKVQTPVILFYTFLLNMEKKFRGSSGHYHRSQRREGKDISIITYGAAVYKCLEAANELAKIGALKPICAFYDPWTKPLLGFRF
jgi:pyruvate/2-oxoglutarate/acetoin dehydrogenase E1 component